MIIEQENLHYYVKVESNKIASGMDFPINKILEYTTPPVFGPRGLEQGRGDIFDFAGGAGKKTRELKKHWFTPHLIDINPESVEAINHGDLFGYLADILEFGQGFSFPEHVRLEKIPFALYNAVFSSVPFTKALKVGDMYMFPGAHVFCVDMVAADRGYKELGGSKGWDKSKWRDRYMANAKAFSDLEVSYRTFLVAKPGPWKREIDVCNDPAILREVWERRNEPIGSHKYAGIYERFASHFDPNTFRKYVTNILGYQIKEEFMGLTSSRDPRNGSSPTYYAVLQKPFKYRFSPALYGLDPRKVDTYDVLTSYNDSKPYWWFNSPFYRALLDNMAKRGVKSKIIEDSYQRCLDSEPRIEAALRKAGRM